MHDLYKDYINTSSTNKIKYCSNKKPGDIYKDSIGNSYTLVVDNKTIRDGNVTNLLKFDSPFYYKDLKINSICTSHVTDMSHLFEKTKEVTSNITNFDTSNVTDMSYMFAYTRTFNQPISHWNTSSVQNMSYMFYRARSFNKPLHDWNVSKVQDMEYMFAGAYHFNQPINNWNVFNVEKYSHFISPTSSLDREYIPNFLVLTFSMSIPTKKAEQNK